MDLIQNLHFVLEFSNHLALRWAPIKILNSEFIKKISFYFL